MKFLFDLLRRRRMRSEAGEEVKSHIAERADELKESGLSEYAAQRQAEREFGNATLITESSREVWRWQAIETVLQDTRYGIRQLRRSPGFTAVAVLSLALGLGASLAVYTVADNVLVRPLPYKNSPQLVMLWEANPQRGFQHGSVSPGNYFDWKQQSSLFDGMAAMRDRRSVVLIDGERAEEFGKQRVSADFFPLLGIQPVRGRLFTTEEDLASISSDSLLLISYRLWQSWFNGDDDVIGRKVLVSAVPRTIIGVLPQGFYFMERDVDLWEPIGINPAQDYRNTEGRWMTCVARMRTGISASQAQIPMTALARRTEAAYPAFNKNWTVQVEPLRDAMFRDVKTSLWVLLGAVGLMLAVACANVANLLLARYGSRQREIAVRASLGAGRWRVIRQLLTESIVLSLAGGLCGLALARWAVAGLLALAPGNLAQSAEIHVDARIFAVAFALSLLTGILFGIAPALVTSRADLVGALRADSRSGLGAGGHLRAWLVAAEVAISVILLTGAILLFRSLVGFEGLNPGLDASNVLTFRVSLPDARYQKVGHRTQFFQNAMQQMEQLPGVHSASAVIYLPLSGANMATYANVEGRAPAKPGEEIMALIRCVMPGYFRTLRIPLKQGRDFSESDNLETAPFRFVVNEAFVRQFFRGEHPLGKKINALMESENPFGEIIGVVGDVREWALDREPMPIVYYPYAHLSFPGMIFVVRSQNSPLSLGGPARRIIRSLDPAQPIAEIRTMEDILGDNLARHRFSAWLLSGFSAAALVLSAIGIYGVLAYSVTARTRELGVRMALGADSASIIGLVLKAGARPVIGGVAAGILGAFSLTGLLKSLLFGIAPRDPLTFAIVPCVLATVALVAACLPARRASRLDPMDALRME